MSVKVTKHGTIPYVRYGFLLVCYSNFSQRLAVFQIFEVKKCCDLEIRVKGQSSSLKVVPFHRVCSVVTLSLTCKVFEIFDFKNAVTLKTG